MGPEAKIEKIVCDYAAAQGCLVYKFVSPSRRSVPDRIFFFRGSCWMIEFKAPGKKVTEAQRREIERLEAEGCRVYVVDNMIEGKSRVENEIYYALNS
jgi:hypothetical protein